MIAHKIQLILWITVAAAAGLYLLLEWKRAKKVTKQEIIEGTKIFIVIASIAVVIIGIASAFCLALEVFV